MSPHIAWLCAVLVVVVEFIFSTSAAAQETIATKRYQQALQVLAKYTDVAVALDTPALRPGRTTFTSQRELESFLDTLTNAPRSAGHMTQLTLGSTSGGRTLHALLLSAEGAKTPAALAQLNRPIVWMIGQQHGNEPAGGEAMLALAAALADGELTPLLDKISIVIIPRANPDGAALDTRENAAGADLNRDHALFSQVETRLIHGLVRQAPPAVVIDAHEYTVGRRWVATLGGLQAVDLMLLSSTHPMTPRPLIDSASQLFLPAIEAAIAQHKLTSFVYHTTATRAGERSITVGGSAPGIARNAFGLMGVMSFLLETRGAGIGLDSYQRRVATHYIAARAILQTAAANAATVVQLREAVTRSRPDIIIAHTVSASQVLLPLIDPMTGADKSADVSMHDTRNVTGVESRARPAGYLIAAERYATVREQLELLGAHTCRVSRRMEVDVERYEVTDRVKVDQRAINPERNVRVRMVADREMVNVGDVFVPADQPASLRLMLALEPDVAGSLSAQTLLVDDDPTALAVARVPRGSHSDRFLGALSCGSNAALRAEPHPRRTGD